GKPGQARQPDCLFADQSGRIPHDRQGDRPMAVHQSGERQQGLRHQRGVLARSVRKTGGAMGNVEAVLSGQRGPLSKHLRPHRIDPCVLLVLPAALLMAVCFAWPVLQLLTLSVSQPAWGLGNYQALINHKVFAYVLWNTVVISASVDLFCLLIGYPVAYSMASARPRTRRILIFVVLIPFWSSVLVRSFAWMVLLQRHGLVNDMLVAIGFLR